jgi:hypothetical protein
MLVDWLVVEMYSLGPVADSRMRHIEHAISTDRDGLHLKVRDAINATASHSTNEDGDGLTDLS